MDKKLLTIEEVAEYLNVKVSWVRSAIFRREIPYLKVGNLVRFSAKELHEWIEKNSVSHRES